MVTVFFLAEGLKDHIKGMITNNLEETQITYETKSHNSIIKL